MTRQAYYQYVDRKSEYALEEELVLQQVKLIRQRQPMIGTRKLYGMLAEFMIEHQINIGRDALFDLLASNGMLIRRRKRKTRTTFSSPWLKYPNLIKGLEPDGANQVWVADITYWQIQTGYVYISLITDMYSRKIVGYHVAETLLASNSAKALRMALENRTTQTQRHIHHSDRGIQYGAQEYVNLLQDYQVEISMSRKSDPLENAIAERVNGILKNELLTQVKVGNLEQAQVVLKEMVEIYNQERPHLSIALLTPQQAHLMKGKLERDWKSYYPNKTVNPC